MDSNNFATLLKRAVRNPISRMSIFVSFYYYSTTCFKGGKPNSLIIAVQASIAPSPFTARFTKPPDCLSPYRTSSGEHSPIHGHFSNGHFSILQGTAGNRRTSCFVNHAVNGFVFLKLARQASRNPMVLIFCTLTGTKRRQKCVRSVN